MSLWQVSDEATRDLMVAYYKRLKADEGRAEALRQVQLQMLRRDNKPVKGGATRGLLGAPTSTGKVDYSHPYYWAAFIGSGDWRPMTQPTKSR